MLVQLQNPRQKRPGHFVGTHGADFTFPDPADSLSAANRFSRTWRIRQNFPGSHGNPSKTQGCEGTGCPLPRKAVGPPAEPRNQRQAPAEVFGGGRPERQPSGIRLRNGRQGRVLDSRNLSRIVRKLEENSWSRVDRLPVSVFFRSAPGAL